MDKLTGRIRSSVRQGLKIAVVVPCYNVAGHLTRVVETLPDYVRWIILVNDASRDETGRLIDRLAGERVIVIHLPQNQGVGGAMLAGLEKAAQLGADILIKMDGDGQMDPARLPQLIEPLVSGSADYTKGNRFRSALSLAPMPLVRKIGNAALSLMTRFASGYWNVFDPNNGYTAMRREIFEILPKEMIHPRYFFESSMLITLGILRAVVTDVPMDARYGAECSHLNVWRSLFEFPWNLIAGFSRRVWLQKILYSLTIEAVLGILGFFLFSAGAIFGIIEFIHYALLLKTAAPAGTVMTAALPVFLGFQMMLNAVLLDILTVPTRPLTTAFLPETPAPSETSWTVTREDLQ